jgi:type II secretory pathway component PulJ
VWLSNSAIPTNLAMQERDLQAQAILTSYVAMLEDLSRAKFAARSRADSKKSTNHFVQFYYLEHPQSLMPTTRGSIFHLYE